VAHLIPHRNIIFCSALSIVVARRLVSCQHRANGKEEKVLFLESLPDCTKSSAARELGNTARKTSDYYYIDIFYLQ
jgi:hypothetical protein